MSSKKLLSFCDFKLRRWISTSCRLEAKVKLGDLNIHYRKVGNGPHVVLLCPGFVGSVQETFGPVLKKMNPKEFTSIAWDPPGYGRSRPPPRNVFTEEFALLSDARLALKMMEALKYDSYSIIGHSNGGVTAGVMAGLEQERVRKVVMCNSPYYFNQRAVKVVEMMGDLQNWTPDQRAAVRRVYEAEYFDKLCSDWKKEVSTEAKNLTKTPALYENMGKVKCPVLYILGMKDILVTKDEPEGYLKLIKTSRLATVPEGGHDHLEFLEDFVHLSEKFLLED